MIELVSTIALTLALVFSGATITRTNAVSGSGGAPSSAIDPPVGGGGEKAIDPPVGGGGGENAIDPPVGGGGGE